MGSISTTENGVAASSVSRAGNYLSENIRCLRRLQELSQEEFAQRVGLNRGNIASYENGTAEPKIVNLLKISSLLGVSIDDLIQRDLSCDTNRRAAYAPINEGEQKMVSQFERHATDVNSFLKSIDNCYQFKVKSLEQPDRETQMVMAYFEQLHEVSQSLLRQHQNLIDFIHCKCQ